VKSKVSVQPAIEPVSLAELKDALRITASNEDTLLTQLIIDARTYAEDYTGRKFITQTITSYGDNFGSADEEWFTGHRVASLQSIYVGKRELKFDWVPSQSITLVETIDSDNTETTYSATNYYLDNFDNNMFPCMILNDTADIPTSLRRSNNIKVTWIAGYGDNATDVPASIRRGIIMAATHLYSNRGDCGGDCITKSGANQYLDKYKMLET
jgi:uncharacterized phiE125 gp8 family phage protein